MAAFIGPAIAGLSAIFGLFNKKQQKSDSTFNSSTTPTYDPQSLAFKNLLESLYTGEVSPDALNSFGNSYITAGIKNIQNSSTLAQQAAADALSNRGIARTTAGAQGVSDTSQSEGQNLSAFLNQAPLLLDQRKQSLLSGAGGFLASLPVGSTTTGSSHTTGSVGPSFSLPGLIQGAAGGTAGILGQIAAQNAAKKAQTAANSSLADILKSITGNVTLGTGSSGAGVGGGYPTDYSSPTANADIEDDSSDTGGEWG